MSMIKAHDELSIQLFNTDDEPPFTVHGTFVMEDDTDMMVRGTVGDDIGKYIIIPKRNVKVIYNLSKNDQFGIRAHIGEPQSISHRHG